MKMNKKTYLIREYRNSDIDAVIAIFKDTVYTINSKDYSFKQIEAWTNIDVNKWVETLEKNYSLVAIIDENIVGFGDIDDNNHLDRLYVHKDYLGLGIATSLCGKLEARASKEISTFASISAKGFFENRGYSTIKAQEVCRHGIYLTNYVMLKKL